MDQDGQSTGKHRSLRSVDLEFDFAGRRFAAARASVNLSPRTRFPAMFHGPHLGLTLYRGWNPILLAACISISRQLAFRPMAFHWAQLREEDGVGRFLYALGEESRYFIEVAGQSRRAMIFVSRDQARDLAKAIDSVANEAERLCGEACMVCGARTGRTRYFGRVLPLCTRHHPEFLNLEHEEGLDGVWRRSIEWEAPGGRPST